VYPPSQGYKPYHDASSEEASVHGGEDESFLEKGAVVKRDPHRRWYHPKSLLKAFCCGYNASILSALLSFITASLVIAALFLLTTTIRANGTNALSSALQSKFCPDGSGVKPAGQLQHLHCGSTPDEARALNCVFDVMSFAWTPKACYDHEHSVETMDRTGPWIFYLDHNATEPVPFEQLTDELVVWTEHSYHVSHCLYAWERIHRAYLGSMILPAELGSINHTLHCRDLLNDASAPRHKVNAIAYMVFDSCVDLN
jgi:hypothetical protein